MVAINRKNWRPIGNLCDRLRGESSIARTVRDAAKAGKLSLLEAAFDLDENRQRRKA